MNITGENVLNTLAGFKGEKIGWSDKKVAADILGRMFPDFFFKDRL